MSKVYKLAYDEFYGERFEITSIYNNQRLKMSLSSSEVFFFNHTVPEDI